MPDGGGDASVNGAMDSSLEEVVLEADLLVNAAGLWSTQLSKMMGLHHPAYVIEHQYAITQEVPAIAQRMRDDPVRMNTNSASVFNCLDAYAIATDLYCYIPVCTDLYCYIWPDLYCYI
jgi:glycine/D-amino acid oxidase-like deaminating enzyme